jgi:hypothetical protein
MYWTTNFMEVYCNSLNEDCSWQSSADPTAELGASGSTSRRNTADHHFEEENHLSCGAYTT